VEEFVNFTKVAAGIFRSAGLPAPRPPPRHEDAEPLSRLAPLPGGGDPACSPAVSGFNLSLGEVATPPRSATPGLELSTDRAALSTPSPTYHTRRHVATEHRAACDAAFRTRRDGAGVATIARRRGASGKIALRGPPT